MAKSATALVSLGVSGVSFAGLPWYCRLALGLAALAVVALQQVLRHRWLLKVVDKITVIDSSDAPAALRAAGAPHGRPRAARPRRARGDTGR